MTGWLIQTYANNQILGQVFQKKHPHKPEWWLIENPEYIYVNALIEILQLA